MNERDTSSSEAPASAGASGHDGEAVVEEPFDPAECGEAAAASTTSAAAADAEAGPNAERAEGGPSAGPPAAAEQPPSVEGETEPATPPPPEPTLEERLASAKEAQEKVRQQMLRVAADFDNFRKRTVRDLDGARRRARQGVLRDLFPVFDNLERAVAHVSDKSDPAAIAEGIRMVLKQFQDTLRRMEVVRVDPTGEPFDPTVHESIQLVESSEHPAGTIVTVIQPGYLHGEELIRPSLVAVSKGPPAPPAAEPSAADGAEAKAPDEPATDAAAGDPGGDADPVGEQASAEDAAPEGDGAPTGDREDEA